MGENQLSLEIQGKEAILQINREEKLNALNESLLRELGDAVVSLRERTAAGELAVLRLRTAGQKAFVAGADIKAMSGKNSVQAKQFASFGAQVFQDLSQLPLIVVAEVQGFALGGGFELALAADFIVAAEQARFGLPEVGLGLIPGFGGTQRLSRRCGYSRALDLTLTGRQLTAPEAESLGIVNRVSGREELRSTADELVGALLKQGPQALQAAKFCVQASLELELHQGLQLESQLFGACFDRPESREGMSAFLEKRGARF